MTAVAVVLAAATTLVYENDFSTRSSASALGSEWSVYEYDKGGPVAYDYDATGLSSNRAIPYPWSNGGVYSQQDGWVKAQNDSQSVRRGRSSISDEADPALVFSDKDLSVDATNHNITIYHTFRNVFTNGVIKMQFDVRQVDKYVSSKLLTWTRLIYDKQAMNNHAISAYPIELGLSSSRLSGGWRDPGQPDDNRTFHSFTNATWSHWYRYYVTCDLDSMRSSFEVYDLGTGRIGMDDVPVGEPYASASDLLFRKNLDESTGGISGISIRVGYCDTKGYYGEEGFDEGYAYKYDNIKASWKAPSSDSFVEFYRNDFSKSKRRTIDGSLGTSHTYKLADNVESSSFYYYDELVRDSSDGTQIGTPYLPAKLGTVNKVQEIGVDGWRFCGASGYKGTIAVTTNGSNKVGMLTKDVQVMQPMCPDVTSGKAKFEYDFRMPAGWNGNYGNCYLILISRKGYDEAYNYANMSLVNVGPCSADGQSNATTPVATYSVANSSKTSVTGKRFDNSDGAFKPLRWYRIQVFIDLDNSTYESFVYDIGASAPTTPDDFDSSDTNTAIRASGVRDLFRSNSPDTTKDPQYYGKAIGAYGFVSWNNPAASTDYAILVDNVRFWKGDWDDWTLLFQNTFAVSKRIGFERKSLNIVPSGYFDRPEHGEDGWALAPTFNSTVHIAGANPALEAGDGIRSVVQPLGRTIRSGKFSAQYDVRAPMLWNSSMDYFWLQFGGGAMASASTWAANAYRYQTHPVIRTGMQPSLTSGNVILTGPTGIRNMTGFVAQDGTGAGGDGAMRPTKHVDQTYVGHWIRVRIDADMNAKKWTHTVYDMGTEHPTADTANGTLLGTKENLNFVFNDPITHMHIIMGRSPSYAPWSDDLPGEMLVDNIRVWHDREGLSITIK